MCHLQRFALLALHAMVVLRGGQERGGAGWVAAGGSDGMGGAAQDGAAGRAQPQGQAGQQQWRREVQQEWARGAAPAALLPQRACPHPWLPAASLRHGSSMCCRAHSSRRPMLLRAQPQLWLPARRSASSKPTTPLAHPTPPPASTTRSAPSAPGSRHRHPAALPRHNSSSFMHSLQPPAACKL